jgi:hypothetical protein
MRTNRRDNCDHRPQLCYDSATAATPPDGVFGSDSGQHQKVAVALRTFSNFGIGGQESEMSSGGKPVSVKLIRRYATILTIIGWLAGLVFYEWFAFAPFYVPLWDLCLLAIFGAFLSTIIITNTVQTIAGAITYKLTGNFEGSTDIHGWSVVISPLLAFVAAKYVLKLSAQLG